VRKLLDICVEDYLKRLGYLDINYNWVDKSPVDGWRSDIRIASVADCAALIRYSIKHWEEEL
jgi:hypothetical protein